MNLRTNIALKGDNGLTSPYVIQLFPGSINVPGDFVFVYSPEYSSLIPETLSKKFQHSGDNWYEVDNTGDSYDLNPATIRLYFPQYSVDTYSLGALYMLTLSTYIHGQEVQLGNYLFKRTDALACSPERFNGMDEYVEYIDFTIVDPFMLHYNESPYTTIRSILGEPVGENSTGALLYVTLNIVEKGDECYMKRTDWSNGQNNILLSDSDELKLNVDYSPVDDTGREIVLSLSFNSTYGGDISTYFEETYGTSSVTIEAQWVVMNNDDIYYEQSKISQLTTSISFDIDNPETIYNEIPFQGNFFSTWNNWQDGLSIKANVSFFSDSVEDIPFMTIKSNKLVLTKYLFARMVQSEGYDDDAINSNFIIPNDMTNINLSAYNTIEQNVTVVTPTDSTKNHLLQPVFYQTRDINSVIIHPAITENIAINLDSYKSQVKQFRLQIEGTIFNETGRTTRGVIFKVYGNMLPKEVNEGTLYILNQDNEMVTSGKYTYAY